MRLVFQNRDRFYEVVAALVVATFASIAFIAVPHLVSGWAFDIPGTTDAALSPSFFPRVALATTASFAVLVAVTAQMRTDHLPLAAMERAQLNRLGQITLINVGYFVGLWLFGFIASSVALLVLLPILVGYRRVLPILATAAILPPIVSLVFWYGLKVVLPVGHLLH
jgi:hypothetical protein